MKNADHTIRRHVTCWCCHGQRFFEVEPGRHMACPVCKLDGCLLRPVIPEKLIEDLLNAEH